MATKFAEARPTRYRWIRPGNLEGATGVAWPAPGCDDPSSVTEGAWCFLPDRGEEEVAYYCDPDVDLEALDDSEDVPLCARVMKCLCYGHANGAPADEPCNPCEPKGE